MATIRAGNITKNSYVVFKNAPHQVTRADFMSPGKGSAFMRCRLRNVVTGFSQEFTFKSNESVEVADIDKKEMQFLYMDGADAVFMNPNNYEQITLAAELVDGKTGYLTPDLFCKIVMYQEKPIGIMLPPNVTMKVVEAQDAVAGNRVNAPKKPVKLETGMEILAPLFVKAGDMVIVDTESGEYLSRANG
jgi:elongation factor P